MVITLVYKPIPIKNARDFSNTLDHIILYAKIRIETHPPSLLNPFLTDRRDPTFTLNRLSAQVLQNHLM